MAGVFTKIVVKHGKIVVKGLAAGASFQIGQDILKEVEKRADDIKKVVEDVADEVVKGVKVVANAVEDAAGKVFDLGKDAVDSVADEFISFFNLSSPRKQVAHKPLKQVANKPPKLVVKYFWASCCAICRLTDPAFDAMVSKYPGVDFIKINVEKFPDVAFQYKLEGVPTYVLIKEGKEITRVIGDDLKKLHTLISNNC